MKKKIISMILSMSMCASFATVLAEETENKTLNVISNNEHINSGWYADNGYTLTYSNSSADYSWFTTGLATPQATSISDEQDAFATTIVSSGTTAASRPDMQDGGIAAGADFEANTDYVSGNPKVGIIWDLKDLYLVERMDIICKNGGASNYYLGKAYIYGRASDSDEWTDIGSVTASTDMKKTLWDATVTDSANKRDVYQFDLTKGQYRYIKVEFTAAHQGYFSEMYIFGEEIENKNLNIISNNERINSGWYADNGYSFTYSNSGAEYSWFTTGLATPQATSISDEQDAFDTTIVKSGETVETRPDMQDGGIAAGADFEANTDYVSGNPKVGIIWDLKDVYSVERMDVICRNGGASNYYLGKAYIYGRASDSDEWIDIGSVTASTDMKKTLWDATVTDSANKRDVYQFDLIKGQYRYIKVEFTAVHQGYFSEMYIFGEEIEKKSLNVISNNERINSGWYADNGYELTYSNSGADYLWTTTGLTTPLATSISDEQDVFDTTIVRSGETAASRPDMQDGGIAAGADYEANTDYNSTGSPRLGIVWDLKNVYRVDRLDIVNKYGTQNYYLGKVYIYGKASASDEWTSIGSVTASTEMKKSLWDTTVTDNANKRELYEFDLVSGNYRYIKVEIIAKSQANISEMYIFGEKVADEEKTYPLSFGESEYTILDTNYNIIDELKGAEIVSISGNIINNDSSDVSVKVYSAIYDSTNKLIAVEVTETITVLSDGAKWENTFEELGGLPENAYLVNFAWADNLTPLAQAQNK